MSEFLRRVLKALALLALGFILGLAATQAQAGTVFLPFIANAGAEVDGATVEVTNLHHYVSDGWHRFLGEVVNETPYTVSIGWVTIYLLDANGLPVASESGYPLTSVIPPGERVPFRESVESLPPFHSIVGSVPWCPADHLAIESKELTEQGSSWVVTVRIRNQLSVRVDSVRVGAVLYGPSGQAIGYRRTYDGLGPLEPGQTLTASLGIYDWDTSITPTSCGVIAFP